MNTPTVPIADPRAEDVRSYIGAVRAWLDDLAPEEVDDLTLGMEADLAERAAEGEVRLGEMLGDPAEYAAELRSAAGLPPRTTVVEGPPSPGFWARSVDGFRREAHQRLEDWPWLRELRPSWWLARGLVAGWLVNSVFGTSLWLMPVLLAAGSFWLGRWTVSGRRPKVPPPVLVLANVLALLLLVPALAGSTLGTPTYEGEPYVPSGVVVDGAQVQDLFVYDAQGNRVEGARIFDQSGKGLFVDPDTLSYQDGVPMRPDGTPDVATDVFPLDLGTDDAWANPWTEWTPPLTLPALPEVSATPDTPGPSLTPSPSDSGSEAPQPTPTATPSPSDSGSEAPQPTPTGTDG